MLLAKSKRILGWLFHIMLFDMLITYIVGWLIQAKRWRLRPDIQLSHFGLRKLTTRCEAWEWTGHWCKNYVDVNWCIFATLPGMFTLLVKIGQACVQLWNCLRNDDSFPNNCKDVESKAETILPTFWHEIQNVQYGALLQVSRKIPCIYIFRRNFIKERHVEWATHNRMTF